jgi:4a-hydroxytetrahydrobiopterin dehydratase
MASALLSDAQVAARLERLPGWRRAGSAIVKEFAFAGFPEAVAIVERLVAPSEAADHHPDLAIHYRRVVVTFTTHSAGGLTAKDFDGAAAAEAVVGSR